VASVLNLTDVTTFGVGKLIKEKIDGSSFLRVVDLTITALAVGTTTRSAHFLAAVGRG
jgi:hypothetical protein